MTSPPTTLRSLLVMTLATLACAQSQAGQNPSGSATLPPAATPLAPQPVPSPQDTLPSPPPVRLNRLGQTVLSPRISDITTVANTVPHLLNGIGLVVGLPPGNGASDRSSRQAILNFVKKHGLNVTIGDVSSGTTALVSLTAELPAFSRVGTRLDVKVEVVSDAKSLRGGVLLLSSLRGVDGKAYVAAQGQLMVAGFNAAGKNASVQKNPNAVADLLNGGLVIKDLQSSFFSESGSLELRLLNPSPFNASSVAAGIDTALAGSGLEVTAVDPSMVRIDMPFAQRTNANAMRILGLIGNVRVAVENPAKVTIDQVSGTVLAGEGVLISPCVVQVSNLTIAIVEEDYVSQPNALAQGSTERVGRTRVEAQETGSELRGIGGGGATVSDLLQNLKQLGLEPAQLVQVFVALDRGGFLHAKLEVQ